MQAFLSIEQIKRANAAAGMHWFEPGAMRFFRSRVCSDVFPCDPRECTYFVTGETNPAGERRYSVRAAFWENADIDTIGEFHSYTSRKAALGAARRYSRGEPEPVTWSAQVRAARLLLKRQGRATLENPHAMIGRQCKCGNCFTCAAAYVIQELDEKSRAKK